MTSYYTPEGVVNMKELKQIEDYVEQAVNIKEPKVCNTKVKLHNLVLEHKSKCDTITAMENYMSECGVLFGWEDNKDKYL